MLNEEESNLERLAERQGRPYNIRRKSKWNQERVKTNTEEGSESVQVTSGTDFSAIMAELKTWMEEREERQKKEAERRKGRKEKKRWRNL